MSLKTFWSISDTGKVVPEIVKLYEYLNCLGFRLKCNKDELQLYKQSGKFIEQVYNHDLEGQVINYLSNEYKDITERFIIKSRGDSIDARFKPKEVLEAIIKYGFSKIFSEHNWKSIKPLDVEIKGHSESAAYFYFNNKIVQVDKNKIETLEYDTLDGCIYKDVVKDREISIIDIHNVHRQKEAPNGYKFYDFLNKVSGMPDYPEMTKNDTPEQFRAKEIAFEAAAKNAQSKLSYLMQLIGYLSHDYRKKGATDFCVIFCDDEGGGSGKGLIIQALEQMINVCNTDAKQDESRYSSVKLTEKTRLKVYNDVERHFKFSRIYNEITEGGRIEYKRAHEEILDYAHTWKVAITANHVIRGSADSDLRRQAVFSLEPFFSAERNIRDYYNHSFFSADWSKEDWNYFYNVMFKCAQYWLMSNYKKPHFEDQGYSERKLEDTYPIEFRTYVDNIAGDNYRSPMKSTCWRNTGKLYLEFKETNNTRNPFIRDLTSTYFGRLLMSYCKEMDYIFEKNCNRTEVFISRKPER